jgi:hypothetical protein
MALNSEKALESAQADHFQQSLLLDCFANLMTCRRAAKNTMQLLANVRCHPLGTVCSTHTLGIAVQERKSGF